MMGTLPPPPPPMPPPRPPSSVTPNLAVPSLRRRYPGLASQYHPVKNLVKSTAVPFDSKLPHWWKCSKGPDHEWQATISRRLQDDGGCPCCSKVKVSVVLSSTLFANPTYHCPYKRASVRALTRPMHRFTRSEAERDKHHQIPQTGCCREVVQGAESRQGKCKAHINTQALRSGLTRAQIKCQIAPENLMPTSENVKVWFHCDEGPDHNWQMPLQEALVEGALSCPCCEGRKVSVTNRLVTGNAMSSNAQSLAR